MGRWESELFDPVKWRNDYPNPAFVRMTARDAFWAAKILMKFTREELAAIVETGEFSNPENARYFLDVLVERQLKCGRFGINAINPLDEFRVEGQALHFANLSERYGFVEAKTSYEVQWFAFDNETGARRELTPKNHGAGDALAPSGRVEPRDPSSSPRFAPSTPRTRTGRASVAITLRPRAGSYEIVGIERESPEISIFPMN